MCKGHSSRRMESCARTSHVCAHVSRVCLWVMAQAGWSHAHIYHTYVLHITPVCLCVIAHAEWSHVHVHHTCTHVCQSYVYESWHTQDGVVYTYITRMCCTSAPRMSMRHSTRRMEVCTRTWHVCTLTSLVCLRDMASKGCSHVHMHHMYVHICHLYVNATWHATSGFTYT